MVDKPAEMKSALFKNLKILFLPSISQTPDSPSSKSSSLALSSELMDLAKRICAHSAQRVWISLEDYNLFLQHQFQQQQGSSSSSSSSSSSTTDSAFLSPLSRKVVNSRRRGNSHSTSPAPQPSTSVSINPSSSSSTSLSPSSYSIDECLIDIIICEQVDQAEVACKSIIEYVN
jgi:hypothetical protein